MLGPLWIAVYDDINFSQVDYVLYNHLEVHMMSIS